MENESLIRLSVFVILLRLFSALELWKPRRPMPGNKAKRALANISLVALGSLTIRIVLPMSSGLFAAWVTENQASPFGWQLWVVPSIILMDFLIYWQHRIFHIVPLFWRLHKVHHSDNAIDTTTALRFHPVEIVLSMLIKFAAIWLFGIPVLAVILFEIILNATAMFNHSNIRVPGDSILRLFIVTPDMHRVHHSDLPKETNSNYGFNLPWWDRLFGSYIAQPQAGHEAMVIGLKQYDGGETSPLKLLWMPFSGLIDKR